MYLQKFVPLIARTFLAILFVRAGLTKIPGFAGTQQMMADAGIPLTSLALVLAILIEVLGGLSIIVGFKARWGAILLILFLIPATLIFHNPIANPDQAIHFFKNLSILGGLLLIWSYGAGPISIDSRQNSDRSVP